VDSLRPRSMDWSLVITLVVLGAGMITQWVVLREAVENLRIGQTETRSTLLKHDERLDRIESNRALEERLSELKTEVVLLRREVERLIAKEKPRR
jgi:hypothetical protein